MKKGLNISTFSNIEKVNKGRRTKRRKEDNDVLYFRKMFS